MLFAVISDATHIDLPYVEMELLGSNSARSLLNTSVQIPPLLLYFGFVCGQSGIRDAVSFLAPACVSTVGAEIQWCRIYSMVQLHGASFFLTFSWLAFCFRFSSATFTPQLRDFWPRSIFYDFDEKSCYHFPFEALSYVEINHGNMQCGSCNC